MCVASACTNVETEGDILETHETTESDMLAGT